MSFKAWLKNKNMNTPTLYTYTNDYTFNWVSLYTQPLRKQKHPRLIVDHRTVQRLPQTRYINLKKKQNKKSKRYLNIYNPATF